MPGKKKASKAVKAPRSKRNKLGYSPLAISGKHKDFEYSFRSKKEMEECGGISADDWEVIDATNNAGEGWAEKEDLAKYRTRAHGKDVFVYQDAILCKRHKKFGEYEKLLEDEKYNSNISTLKNFTRTSRFKLRDAVKSVKEDYEGDVTGGISGRFKQRAGLTEKEY